MTTSAPLKVFFPTRFHIFDQLATPTFIAQEQDFEIFSVYPPSFFRANRFQHLKPHNRTLWLGLALLGLLRVSRKLGIRGAPARGLRRLYISGCAAEFRLRTRAAAPSVVLASAGYLGQKTVALQHDGHRVVINHGSLHETSVRARLQALPGSEEDVGANWSHPWLTDRMDLEFAAADEIVVCSPTALASFPEALQEKVRVVPLGAPATIISKSQRSSDPGTVFLHISNLSFGKNTGRILDAFKKMRGANDRLVIGGPAPNDPALRERLAKPDSFVTWLGKLDREGVSEAMASADIFVHPSFADGWGMVITEALAAGLPVIASPYTGAATYYEPSNPETIALVDPLDTDQLADAMRDMSARLAGMPKLKPHPPLSWEGSAQALHDVLAPLREMARAEPKPS